MSYGSSKYSPPKYPHYPQGEILETVLA